MPNAEVYPLTFVEKRSGVKNDITMSENVLGQLQIDNFQMKSYNGAYQEKVSTFVFLTEWPTSVRKSL